METHRHSTQWAISPDSKEHSEGKALEQQFVMPEKFSCRMSHLYWSIIEYKWTAKKILVEWYQNQREKQVKCFDSGRKGLCWGEAKAKVAGLTEGRSKKPCQPWTGVGSLLMAMGLRLFGWTVGVQNGSQGHLGHHYNDLDKKWRWLGLGLAMEMTKRGRMSGIF